MEHKKRGNPPIAYLINRALGHYSVVDGSKNREIFFCARSFLQNEYLAKMDALIVKIDIKKKVQPSS